MVRTDTLLLLLIVGGGAWYFLFRKADNARALSVPANTGVNPRSGSTQEAPMSIFDDILKAITSVGNAISTSNSSSQVSAQRN